MPNIYDSMEEDEKKLAEEIKELNDDKSEKEENENDAKDEDAIIRDTEQQNSEGDGDEEADAEGKEDPEDGKDGDGEETKVGDEAKADEKSEETKSVLKDETDGMTAAQKSAFARQRRESKAATDLANSLAAQIKERETPKSETKTDDDPEPDKQGAYEAWLEWKDRQIEAKVNKLEYIQSKELREREQDRTEQAAFAQLNEIQSDYIKENPDYPNAVAYGYQTYLNAMKITYPDLTHAEAVKATDKAVLKFASDAFKKGLNPAEEFYSYTIEKFGYTSKAKEEKKEEKKVVPLRTIENNKRRSASPLAGGGQDGASHKSLSALPEMSVGEFANLTSSQLDALEAEARNSA